MHNEGELRPTRSPLLANALPAAQQLSNDGLIDSEPAHVLPRQSSSTGGPQGAAQQVGCDSGLVTCAPGSLCLNNADALYDCATLVNVDAARSIWSAICIAAWPFLTQTNHEKQYFDAETSPSNSTGRSPSALARRTVWPARTPDASGTTRCAAASARTASRLTS